MPPITAAPSTKAKKAGSGIDEILRSRLTTGIWAPNDRLPTEKELAREFNVCKATVQRHLLQLQKEGLIWGHRGKGRFVTGPGQRRRTNNIGVVLFDSRHMTNPATSEMVAAVGAVAAEVKRSIRIFVGNELPVGQADAEGHLPGDAGFLGPLGTLGVDGLIILTQRIPTDAIRQLANLVPVVSSSLVPLPNVSCVVMDVASGTFDAARHLLDLGHRRIAMIEKDLHDSFGRASREGARLAMKGVAGVGPDALQIATPTDFTPEEGYRLAKEFLAQPNRPTAIICGDHLIAEGVLQACEELGLKVPDDLSVVACNSILADRRPVSITSVSFDRAGVGSRLCRRLLELIEQPERQFEPEYVTSQLLIRQSTGAPPKTA
jgi:DNA-binding LacI/PurR family transcriptional regulator